MDFRAILLALLAVCAARCGAAQEYDFPDPDVIVESADGGRVLVPGRRAPAYDPLPLRMADMDRYERLAMEPYADRYDSLSLPEKTELYSRQFELLHGRAPRFAPDAPGGADAAADFDAPGPAAHSLRPPPGIASPPYSESAADTGYDVLPRRFADLGEYDRIALEPYRDRYDDMPLAEQAEAYSQAFEFMNNRHPRFSPGVEAEIRRAGGTAGRRARASRPDMYKPPEEKKKRPSGVDLGAVAGPWGPGREAAPPEAPVRREGDEKRFESLRKGWNARDVVRGVREE